MKNKDTIRKLVMAIEPEMEYPVNYVMCGNNKIQGKYKLLGKDLTENQIVELYSKKIIKPKEDKYVWKYSQMLQRMVHILDGVKMTRRKFYVNYEKRVGNNFHYKSRLIHNL